MEEQNVKIKIDSSDLDDVQRKLDKIYETILKINSTSLNIKTAEN